MSKWAYHLHCWPWGEVSKISHLFLPLQVYSNFQDNHITKVFINNISSIFNKSIFRRWPNISPKFCPLTIPHTPPKPFSMSPQTLHTPFQQLEVLFLLLIIGITS